MKKFLAIASVLIFIFTGLLVWGVVAGFNYLVEARPQVIVQEKIQLIQGKVQKITNVSLLQCWDKAHNIFSNELWLSFPLMNTIESLKTACFQQQPADEPQKQNGHSLGPQVALQKEYSYD